MNLIFGMAGNALILKKFVLFFDWFVRYLVGGLDCQMVEMLACRLVRLSFAFVLVFWNNGRGFSLMNSSFVFGFRTYFGVLGV